MRHTRTVEIGSISSGTLNPSDLFSAFMWECKHIRLTRSERNRVRAIDANTVREPEDVDERLQEDVEELSSILENHAPPYFYFGAHPGDGADFGFWLSEDALSEFDGLRVNDTSEVPRGYSGEVLHVNDHGNTTLYVASRGRLREVWAIV